MNKTITQRVSEIEVALHRVRVAIDGRWVLYFTLNPRMFVAYDCYSHDTYNLGGSKNDAAKYFNKLVNNEELPAYMYVT